MPGRRPKPDTLHDLHGRPGKRKPAKAEATPEAGVPDKPTHLTERASGAWDILVPALERMRVLSKVNAMALELLCDAYGEFRQAREVVEEKGHSYETQSITGGLMVRMRPEVRIASDAWRRVRSMLVEFGITPASIGKVKAAPQEDEEEKSFQLFLFKGGKADTPKPARAPKKQTKKGVKRGPRRR